MQNSNTSCGSAHGGGTAVGPHVGRGRGGRVQGAGLDELDGLARLGAAVGRGRARNVPERYVFFRSWGYLKWKSPLQTRPPLSTLA